MAGNTDSSIKPQPSFLKNKKPFLVAGVALFLTFIIFTYLVKKDIFSQLDFNLTVRIQDKIPRKIDRAMSFFSSVGKFEVVAIVLLTLLILRKKISGIFVFFLFGVAHLGEVFLKYLLHQPPPPYLFYRNDNPTSFAKDYINPGSSYPSGHSFRAMFMAIILSYLVLNLKKLNLSKRSMFIIGSISVAALIILSKISLGEHWPTDIVGGILLGLSFGSLSLLFL